MGSEVIFRAQSAGGMDKCPQQMTRDPIFAADVREYLLRTPRQLPSKYFYDALGSALFDAICELPWYRITRAEQALIAAHGREMLDGLPRSLSIAELGCGNGEKLVTLVSAWGDYIHSVHLIDISPSALETTRRRLEPHDVGQVVEITGGYEVGLEQLRRTRGDGALVMLFLGSNIGNFDPPAAAAFLRQIRATLRKGDAFLLGTDLVKPEGDLLLAYDDPLQVTAAFNRNILRRINDELGANFDLDAFAHRALWDPQAQRVEMHLVSRLRQHVAIPACSLDIQFEAGDFVWTESSYKYDPQEVMRAGTAAGFSATRQWVDRDARFAVTRFECPS